MLDNLPDDLSHAVLQTVAYADVFDFPLTAAEIHRYLVGMHAPFAAVVGVLDSGLFGRAGDFFTLPGREGIAALRIKREAQSKKLMPNAIRYGRILGTLPFIRMVALTGSLAVMNVSQNQDFDYMLVAARGRVWTARAFALVLNRLTRLRGFTLCPNLIVSEAMLEWGTHDLYSARELCQMIPITGPDMYARLLNANQWVKSFLPNAFIESSRLVLERSKYQGSAFQRLFEFLLRGKIGDALEAWEMNRKIARLHMQAGFGDETIFNADLCQGNFDQHRARTREDLAKRLTDFELAAP